MTNVIKLADRRPRKAPASPPDHDWVGHYQERLDQDSDRLRKLLLQDFNDPEVLRECTRLSSGSGTTLFCSRGRCGLRRWPTGH